MPVKKGMILMVNLMERFDGHFSQELIVTVGVSINPQIGDNSASKDPKYSGSFEAKLPRFGDLSSR
jgi:hypothetical protein